MNIHTKLSACLAALGLGIALGQAAEDAKPEGTHAEIEPIRFGTHPSGKSITIKTIALSHDGDLLVGISWGEGKMEFAQPRTADNPGPRNRRLRDSGELMRALPVLVALDADGDGEISTDEIENAAAAWAKLDKNGDGRLGADKGRPSRGGIPQPRSTGRQAHRIDTPG